MNELEMNEEKYKNDYCCLDIWIEPITITESILIGLKYKKPSV